MRTLTFLSTLLILLTFLPKYSLAQDNELDQNDWREWTRGSKMVKTTSPNEKIEGTPYFNPNWTKGSVHLRSNSKADEVLLRFNTNTNELEFKKDDEILIAIPRVVTAFNLLNQDDEKTYFKSGFKSPEHDIYPGLFLRIIHDGKIKLVAHHDTEFMRAHSVNPLTGKKVSRYISKKDYYLISEDGKFHDIKLKRKHILRAVGEKKDLLRSFAKTNDLDFGEENDVAEILSYYESL